MRVYLDTDLNFPSDDFQALMLLLAARDVEIVGCGAAAGNTWAEEVFANIRLAGNALGKSDLMVWKGLPYTRFSPRHGPAVKAKVDRVRNFIGAYEKSSSPRGWVMKDECDYPAISAAEALIALSHEYGSDLSVVCIGPLSNVGRALEIDPRLPERLKTVIIMGGHFASSHTAERKVDFNFWFDPEAAHKVLNSGMDIRLVPLDVCQDARLTGALLGRIARLNRGRAALFVDDFLGMVRQHGPSMSLADQLVAILHLAPDLILLEQRARVDVDASNGDSRGMSTLVPNPTGNIRVVRQIDVEGAHGRMLDLVERMGDQYCKSFELFQTPSYQYCLGQGLANNPVTVLSALFDEEYRLDEIAEIRSPAEFARIIGPLARFLVRAEGGSGLWSPSPHADAIVERSGFASGLGSGELSLRELEYHVCERFLNVRAIATISDPGDSPRGFACISQLAGDRLQQLALQFGVNLPTQSILAEYGWVEHGTIGCRALEYIGSRLFLWYSALRPSAENVPILAVSLSSQEALTHELALMGYDVIAQYTIPESRDKGRAIILHSLVLNERVLGRLRSRFGDGLILARRGSRSNSI